MSGDNHQSDELLSVLYDKYGAALYRYLLMILGRKEDAEDTMQNLFVKLSRNPNGLAKLHSSRAYLYTAARNEAISLLRKRGKKQEKEVELTENLIETRDTGVNPDEIRDITQALFSIPPKQREILSLFAFEGLDLNEIGELLGISRNTAASRYRLGLEKMKKIMKWRNS